MKHCKRSPALLSQVMLTLRAILYLILSNLLPKPKVLNECSLTYMTETFHWAKKREKTSLRVTMEDFLRSWLSLLLVYTSEKPNGRKQS